MKKLIVTSILAVSFLTAGASQLLETERITDSISDTEKRTKTEAVYPTVIVEEEVDEPFEFNTKDYLPVGFNATLSLDETLDLEFVAITEEDEPFEFNTNDYLPVGFNLSTEILNSIVEIEIVTQDDEFDFDTAKYLPKGFNPFKEQEVTNKL